MKSNVVILSVLIVLALSTACTKTPGTSSADVPIGTSAASSGDVSVNFSDAEATPTQTKTPEPTEPSGKLSLNDFNNLLKEQPMYVVSKKYLVQSDDYKTLYPDLLQAIIKNNTEFDIKDAVVAFVAWDKNKLPVKIVGSIDYSNGAYVYEVAYSGINLIPGSAYGENSGFEISEDISIDMFESIVVSYETFEGDTWHNPLYESWTKVYSGKKYSIDSEFDNINQ